MKFRWSSILLSCGLLGCAGAPPWVHRKPLVQGKIIGVGSAKSPRSADMAALVDAAQTVEAFVESRFESRATSAGGREDQSIRHVVRVSTARALRNAQTIERWLDEDAGAYWSLVQVNAPAPPNEDLKASQSPPVVDTSAMDRALSTALGRLLEGVDLRLGPRVTVGAIAFQRPGGPSAPLGWLLRSRLLHIARRDYRAKTRTRGLYAAPDSELIVVPSLQIDGHYTLEKGLLQVHLSIIGEAFQRSERVELSEHQVPPGYPAQPERLDHYARSAEAIESMAATLQPQKDLSFRVEVDRGEGATYAVGDVLRLRMTISEPCALRLFHVDSVGGWTQIFPNRHHPSSVVNRRGVLVWPGPIEDFRFRVARPLGPEMIVALVKPLGSQRGEALATRGAMTQAEVQRLAKRLDQGGDGVAVAWTTFTVFDPKGAPEP